MKIDTIQLKDADLLYVPEFFTKKESDFYYQTFLRDFPWEQRSIKMFGKDIPQPRLISFFGNPGKSYKYSGLRLTPLPFTSELEDVKNKTENFSHSKFNVCLANLYRDGSDSMGLHADDERELGQNPLIASISFGAERDFKLQHKLNKTLRHKIRLQHGSLLIMKGTTQEFWKHQLPKTNRKVEPRINLTFRTIR